MKKGFVYILANKTNNVLYVGVTSDIVKRIYEHKNHLVEGFSDRYNVTKLVYVEVLSTIEQAIEREKRIKSWSRKRKEQLINELNPNYEDMYDDIVKTYY